MVCFKKETKTVLSYRLRKNKNRILDEKKNGIGINFQQNASDITATEIYSRMSW